MKRLLSICLIALLAGCAGTITKSSTGAITVNVAAGTAEVATHNDLLAAAAYATAHGYTAVAGVYTAQDTLLTATENQISACGNAIAQSLPTPPSVPAGAGPILKFEIAREAVGGISAMPATVQVNCEPIVLPQLPSFPAIPKL